MANLKMTTVCSFPRDHCASVRPIDPFHTQRRHHAIHLISPSPSPPIRAAQIGKWRKGGIKGGRKEGRTEGSPRSESAVCSMRNVQLLFADDDCPASAERGISPPPSAPNIRHVGEAKGETKKGRNVGYGYGGGV